MIDESAGRHSENGLASHRRLRECGWVGVKAQQQDKTFGGDVSAPLPLPHGEMAALGDVPLVIDLDETLLRSARA